MILSRHTTARDVAIARLVREAAAGDEGAWTEIVDRFDGVLRRVVRNHGVPAADVDDVVQTTWLRALDRIGQLNVPEAIAGWLIVIARREAMRSLQRGVREVLTDSLPEPPASDAGGPDGVVLRQELHTLVRGAVGRLPGRQRRLVASMLTNPTVSYRELSSQLDMPVGAIGPVRGRALTRLSHDRELQQLTAA